MSGSILIVDDEKGQREILTMILQGVGYDTAEPPAYKKRLPYWASGSLIWF